MKIETKENQIILKEVYNSITLETSEGKQLHICMRDSGFEMKLDNGKWHMIEMESDFPIKQKGFLFREPDFPTCGDRFESRTIDGSLPKWDRM